jgi:hypothetical protein
MKHSDVHIVRSFYRVPEYDSDKLNLMTELFIIDNDRVWGG